MAYVVLYEKSDGIVATEYGKVDGPADQARFNLVFGVAKGKGKQVHYNKSCLGKHCFKAGRAY